MITEPLPFQSLREMLAHYAGRRGWHSQRRIATACGLEETALSRFLAGDQDLGARRTHDLFRTVGIPTEEYDLAYELLAQLQEQGRALREARLARRRPAWATPPTRQRRQHEVSGIRWGAGTTYAARAAIPTVFAPPLVPDADVPTHVVLALFRVHRYTSAQIAEFFGG